MAKTIRNEGFHVAGIRRFVQFVEYKGKEYDFPPDRDVQVEGAVADYVLANLPGKGFKLVAVSVPVPVPTVPADTRASSSVIASAAARSIRPGTPDNPATAAEIADSERRTPASPPPEPAPTSPVAPEEVAPAALAPAPVKSAARSVSQVTVAKQLAEARKKLAAKTPPAKKIAPSKAKK